MIILRLAIIASALFHFAFIIHSWRLGVYITKPLTMVLIIILCALAFRGEHDARYVRLFLAGLVFSLAGDIFLMLPGSNYFLPGLFAFLTAHLFYIIALWTDYRVYKGDYLSGGLLLAAGVALFFYLLPFVKPILLGPVLFYILVISLMVWRAVGTAFRDKLQRHQQRLVIAGALLFYVSDLVLALNRFAHSIPMASLIVMVTYFAAQYCLAGSAYRKRELLR